MFNNCGNHCTFSTAGIPGSLFHLAYFPESYGNTVTVAPWSHCLCADIGAPTEKKSLRSKSQGLLGSLPGGNHTRVVPNLRPAAPPRVESGASGKHIVATTVHTPTQAHTHTELHHMLISRAQKQCPALSALGSWLLACESFVGICLFVRGIRCRPIFKPPTPH